MSVADLKAVVESVRQMQEKGEIEPWSEHAPMEAIIPEGSMPIPGEILPDIRDYPYLGAKEITLANGMKVRSRPLLNILIDSSSEIQQNLPASEAIF